MLVKRDEGREARSVGEALLETAPPPLPAGAAYIPLTYGQKALWFLQQSVPENTAYNVEVAARVRSRIDVAALRRAVKHLVMRQPALRTSFPIIDGQPAQAIHDWLEPAWAAIDARDWAWDDLRSQVLAAHKTPFDLERGPLLRVYLYTRTPDDHVLLVSIHHIISDAWVLWIILDELRVLYDSALTDTLTALPPIERTYAEYVSWQNDLLASPEGERLGAYWRQQLAGELPLLNLPTDRPLPPAQRYQGAVERLQIDPAVFRQLRALAKAAGTTLFVTVLTAFQVLLYRYTGREDLLVGTIARGRKARTFNTTIGYFVNPIAIRSDISGDPTFQALLGQVRQTVRDAVDHQEYPFPLLVEQLRLKRDLSHPPIFQVVFHLIGGQLSKNMADFLVPGDTPTCIELGPFKLEPFPLPYQEGAFFLTLELWETDDTARGLLKYNTDLFDAPTIVRMIGHFQQLLAGIAANPGQRISELPLLTTAERRQLLVEWNATEAPYQRDGCIAQLFEAQAKRTPNVVAVVFASTSDRGQESGAQGQDSELRTQNSKLKTQNSALTYRELNTRANQLAHRLRRLGVGPDVLVGICVERSLDMLVGLLGILKAGGAYVPLDPAFPTGRLRYMLEDAQVAVLLTARGGEEQSGRRAEKQTQILPLSPSLPLFPSVVDLDSDWEAIAQESEANPASGVRPEHLAYVLYTSGSTGKPKGVQIEHRALANFVQSMRRQPGLTERDTLLAVTTISFDIAGLELYLPLVVGATLVLAGSDTVANGLKLLELLNCSGATVMQATPATWRMLLAAGWQGSPHLTILCGGEALPQALADQLLEKSAALWNMYGPTETTIWSAICQVECSRPTTDAAISIGHPIANTQLYVLDDQRQPTPIGVPGQLHIGGDGLARGYLNRPDLTAERFIPNPFPDERRTTNDERRTTNDKETRRQGDKETRRTTNDERRTTNDEAETQNSKLNTQNSRLYKTGDLARYLPNGTIEFLGRIDNQVKLRGFRIELGEIESVLNQHPAVRESVALVREDQTGDKRLVAYLVPKIEDRGLKIEDSTASTHEAPSSIPYPLSSIRSELRAFLKQRLPDYMVPAAFVILEALPLTPNGKVDRRALPVPQIARPAEVDPLPQTSIEATLAGFWRQILGIDQVRREDDFFDVGGHSLRATQLIYRVQETFSVGLPIRQLFEAPTLAGMAQTIQRLRHLSPASVSAPIASRGASVPPCLVAIQAGGARPPFVLVHPLVGAIFPYYELVGLLGAEQPFYGLQSLGLTGAEPPLTQIEAMGRHYIEALRATQPEGPYYLGGWSFGAYVAYEMARQLRQAGQSIALLAIIDTPPPSYNKIVDVTIWFNFFLTSVLPFVWPYVHDYLRLYASDAQPALNGQGLRMLERWSFALKRARRTNGTARTTQIGAYQLSDIVRLLRITMINVQAAINYKPEPYPGRITLLRTGQTFGKSGQNPDLGWRALATKGVEIYRVPGHHLDLLRPPHIQVLAGQLKRRIEAASTVKGA